MTLKLGYLLPTRENIMRNEPSAQPLLDGAKAATQLGYESIWAGDSLLARPRHDPLTLLAAVAAVLPEVHVGTAVLLPALRNPVVLAQQLATLDQLANGKLIIGAGIAGDLPSIRQEFVAAGVPFEKRVGRLMESFHLMRALWRGEPVNWQGRWQLENATLAPITVRPEGPPVWLGTAVPAGLARAAKHFDGWFPIGPDVDTFAQRRKQYLDHVQAAGRAPGDMSTALYLTIAVDEDAQRADAQINSYLQGYYNVDPTMMRSIQACFGGPLSAVLSFIRGYVAAGAEHLVIRCVGDHANVLKQLARHRDELLP